VRVHGATVHFVTPTLDCGPIIVQAVVPVIEGDDEAVLGARVLAQEHRIYAQAVRWFVDGRLRLDEAGRVRVADAVFDAQAGCIVPALDAGGGRE
jgi:phosphoribosylglycinamide formyltransferase-1